jgi:hypothetical protein
MKFKLNKEQAEKLNLTEGQEIKVLKEAREYEDLTKHTNKKVLCTSLLKNGLLINTIGNLKFTGTAYSVENGETTISISSQHVKNVVVGSPHDDFIFLLRMKDGSRIRFDLR